VSSALIHKSPTLVALAIGSLIVCMSGCGGGGGGDDGGGTASVTGTIADDGTLTGLAGATVTIGGQSTATVGSGGFNLAGVATSATTIAVTRDGYQAGVFPVVLSAGYNNVGTLYLQPVGQPLSGNVSGTVREGGTAVANAYLQCGGVTARSKGDGTYAVYNVPEGDHTIWAQSADGMKTGWRLVTITSGTTLTGQLILVSEGPPPPPPL